MADARTDTTLMQAIRKGDAESLRELYERYSGTVLGICNRVLNDRHEAEETLLDVFMEVWNRPERFDAERSPVKRYLQLLARSRAIDRLRRSTRKREEVQCGFISELAAGRNDGQSEIVQELQSLDTQYRDVIELSFYSGRSHSEIATQLDIPLGTVKTRIRKAITILRERLRVRENNERVKQ